MYDVKPVTTAHKTACGPACLKMLLKYYGREADLQTLIEECGVNVPGCTAKDLLRVGRAHGLEDISSWKTDAEAVFRQDRPAILWWRYAHFVVYCGLDEKDEPVICNPSSGRFSISRDAFKRLFSGVSVCVGAPHDIIDTKDYFGENEPEPDYFNQ